MKLGIFIIGTICAQVKLLARDKESFSNHVFIFSYFIGGNR